ncbi:telomere length and silencing protein 1 homolog [Mytilus californianus]|uniref:Telomere length and silencing protein 1 homolog n=1 Tax=Mytilus coruscus TaxID=42192 RepID=A0A6J8BFC1_MYTCO|nr:telomere length and silencing protein 1 homolog [Mytilus californianus]CAC5382658.1 Telomere length and silencing protein 1 homolog [Mytilus coruscus]
MEVFKKKKCRAIRKRRHSSESDDNSNEDADNIESKLKDIKELQKQREKPKGVSAAVLALGKKIPKTEEVTDKDPFKRLTGGIVDMKTLKKSDMSKEDVEAIGTAFAAETNRRDEDTEMLKYVEDQLAKKKGNVNDKETDFKPKKRGDTLYALPDKLKIESSLKNTEDMLSNQMLSGIPEVDLGIEAKIKNIEATEDAKQKLIQERLKKRDNEVSDFVPTNMAANYIQHNRFNIEDTAPILKKVEEPKPEPLRVGDAEKLSEISGKKKSSTEKATDDFHYEKFKKHMRR